MSESGMMTLPLKPQAVIFDMDGLMFDTESLYQAAVSAAAEEGGHDVGAILSFLIGRPWTESRGLLLGHFGEDFPVDDFMKCAVRHAERLRPPKAPIKPGVMELLDTLDRLELPRAIATSSGHPTVEKHLTAHDLKGRFHKIVARGDYAASKPAPDPFLKAAELLGVEPRLCLALEDSHHGVRSASSAGMMTVMVPDLMAPTEEIRGLCVRVVHDLHEVREMLLSG